MMSKNRRQIAHRKGKRAELYASIYLFFKGYRILSRRFKTPVGEIDIVARKGSLVVFVEVKARNDITTALDSISYNSQNRIKSAGDWWISRQRDGNLLSWRFDVIAITPNRLPVHFKDVW